MYKAGTNMKAISHRFWQPSLNHYRSTDPRNIPWCIYIFQVVDKQIVFKTFQNESLLQYTLRTHSSVKKIEWLLRMTKVARNRTVAEIHNSILFAFARTSVKLWGVDFRLYHVTGSFTVHVVHWSIKFGSKKLQLGKNNLNRYLIKIVWNSEALQNLNEKNWGSYLFAISITLIPIFYIFWYMHVLQRNVSLNLISPI